MAEICHRLARLPRGTRLILRSRGYTVYEAVDEPSAVTLLKTPDLPIDLMLADLALPGGMLGRQLARELNQRSPRPRLILMSGFNRDVRVPAEFGEFAYLTKPFDAAGLLRTVRRCLDGQGTGARAPTAKG